MPPTLPSWWSERPSIRQRAEKPDGWNTKIHPLTAKLQRTRRGCTRCGPRPTFAARTPPPGEPNVADLVVRETINPARCGVAGRAPRSPQGPRRARAARRRCARRRRGGRRRGRPSTCPPCAAARRAARRPRARAVGVQLVVGDDDSRSGLLHVPRVEGLVVGGGVRIGNEDRRQADGGQLEYRAPRARRHEVGGRERVCERLDVRAQTVVRRRAELVEPGAQLVVVTPPAGATPNTAAAPNASRAAWLRRRAPSEPPNTSRHWAAGSRSKRSRAAARSASPVAAGSGRPVRR